MSHFIYNGSYYSTTLFCEVGVASFYASVMVGLVVLTASTLLAFLTDRVG